MVITGWKEIEKIQNLARSLEQGWIWSSLSQEAYLKYVWTFIDGMPIHFATAEGKQ